MAVRPEVKRKREEVGDRIKKRLDTFSSYLDRQFDIFKESLKLAFELKPVQSAAHLTYESLDNLGDLIKKQAAITREWLKP